MRINVTFDDVDEELEYVDIIDVPESIYDNIEDIQNRFFEWISDKSNDHKYWVIVGGEKQYCSYETDAFVEWMNCNILKNEKVQLIKIATTDIDPSLPVLYF